MNTAIQQDYYRSHLENQLAKHGYTDVEGKTDKELVKILNYYKVKVVSPHSSWF